MLADIQRLSIAERIQLAEDIWDTIALDSDSLPVTDAQREESVSFCLRGKRRS